MLLPHSTTSTRNRCSQRSTHYTVPAAHVLTVPENSIARTLVQTTELQRVTVDNLNLVFSMVLSHRRIFRRRAVERGYARVAKCLVNPLFWCTRTDDGSSCVFLPLYASADQCEYA